MRGAACPYGAGTFTTTTGAIAIPPAGTAVYENNVTCEYLITTGAPIYLRFDSFATEAGVDIVRVYDGPSPATGRLLGSFSGTAIPPVQASTYGSMFIRFTSDRSSSLAGVSMKWSANMATLVPTMSAITPAPTTGACPADAFALRVYCRLRLYAGSGGR
jgi:hypothetical protein